jgi:predicted nucleic acid-binding protein
MILLDTNVVSESMKPSADPAVTAWLNSYPVENFCLSATALTELLTGIEILPLGRRRSLLAEILRAAVHQMFGSRIFPFDQRAAQAYAALFAHTRSNGVSVSVGDGQIAAIAIVHGCTVATRDTAPFIAAGVPTINPWLHT